MADSNTAPTATPTVTLNFDQWREAIQANIKGRDEYKKIRVDLKLPEAGKALAAEFNAEVDAHLAGVDVDSSMAKDMRDALEFSHDICPDPWRGAFITWLKNDIAPTAIITQAVQNPERFTYHGFIGDVCEAFGQALAAKGKHEIISPYYKAENPDAVQYKARLADGTWQDISQHDLVALARKKDGPHIVHSANHAFLDNQSSDLDSLQDSFAKLFDGSRLPVNEAAETKDSGHLSTWDTGNLGPNDTITVFATHTRKNRFLNLAQLFHRLDEVDRAQANPKADTFHSVAPIAVDMVETLLKSIVVDSDVDKIKSHLDASGKPIFFDKQITLRPDAMDIIRRQRYRGFSKGGNDFRDGMRLLVHTLDAKDANSQALVHSPEGLTTHDLINTMSIIVFGLNEKPMADYYREHGVNAPIVSSKNDITAPPSVRHDDDEPSFSYVGKEVGDGHSPQYSVDGMLADWRIHDLLHMHGAVSQGQAAITDVGFVANPDGSYDHNTLTLELAQGTTDAMMDKVITPLNEALHAEGLAGVSIERDASNQGRNRYRLHGDGLISPENMKKVQTVFRALCAEHKAQSNEVGAERSEMPLWVSRATAYGQMSLIRRYLLDEQNGKLDPSSVIDSASLTHYVRLANERDLREHPRTERGQAHARIAETPTGEQQMG